MITHDNIEGYIIDYLSDELTELEIQEMNEFLSKYPEYSEVMDSYRGTFVHEVSYGSETYTHKEALKKSTGMTFQLGKRTLPYAAGIAVLIAGVTYMMTRSKSDVEFMRSQPHHMVTADQDQSSPPLADRHKDDGSSIIRQNPVPRQQVSHQEDSKPDGDGHKNYPDASESKELKLIQAQNIATVMPVNNYISIPQRELVIYTQYITRSEMPDIVNSTKNTDDIEIAFGGRTIDVNMETLKELKNKIDDVKDVIVNKVEDTSLESFNLWHFISK